MTGRLEGRLIGLGVTGSIAAYKAVELLRLLRAEGADVVAMLTPAATAFVGPLTFQALSRHAVETDVLALLPDGRIGHIVVADTADAIVVAPATAHWLGAMAHGLSGDVVTATTLATTAPVVVAPAMDGDMWTHPATRDNVARLREAFGYTIVEPEAGELASGQSGMGRLAELPAIVDAIVAAIGPRPIRATDPAARPPAVEPARDADLTGRHIVVSAGGTREAIDPVRFIGNRSSGKMGFAVAAEAARRGAVVDLVSGPSHLPDPPGVAVHRVETALEMREALRPLADKAEVIVKAAAVADFRPASRAAQKIKKDSGDFAVVRLDRNPDILAELGEHKDGRILVGFAAETDLAEEHGRDKLHRKGLDLIVVNRVDMADSGFGVDTNRAVLLGVDGSRAEVPLTTKAELARVIWDRVETLLSARAPGSTPAVT